MSQFQIPVSMPGGFTSVADAKAHHRVIAKLKDSIEVANSTAADLREADKAEISSSTSDLYQDLAPGKGKVVMLSQPEGQPLMGAELSYNPADNSTRTMVLDFGDSKLSQAGRTFKLEEQGATTFFQFDDKRGVYTVFDSDSEVPRIFGDADVHKLIGSTLQIEQPIILF